MRKSNNKTKTMWHTIKRITNPQNFTQPHKNISLIVNNQRYDSPQLVANLFNEYFASVGASSPGCNGQACGRPVQSPTTNSIYLKPVCAREIIGIIKNLGNKTSFGADEIPPTLVKKCVYELCNPLTTLINQSYDQGTFPNSLKVAKIKPLLKKGGKQDNPSNYRPIALLSTISKIFEKTMANRLYNFLEKYDILDNCQYGFRKNRSTTLAVYNYLQEIYDIINNRKYALGIFLDMTKAYDKVSHTILLSKLYDYGIRGAAYRWFQSYLNDRQQYVELVNHDINNKLETNVVSDIKTVNYSIPQGSVLGCLIFLLYINDLPKSLNTTTILFADDVSLLFSSDLSIDYLHINTVFNDCLSWLQDHNLEINLVKTKLTQFRTYKRTPLDISLLSKHLSIDGTNEFSLLGITLDTNLNWKAHIQKIKTKLSQFVYALGILKANTNYETALSAYYAYAYSWLNYAIILWGDSVEFDKLFVMQKKCVRILTNTKPRDSCRPHFIKNKILTLPSLYIKQASLFVRKNKILFKTKQDNNINYNRRNGNKIELPPTKLKLASQSPHHRLAKIYNKIPEYLKNEEKDTLFCKNLKLFLLEKCYYSVDQFAKDKQK